MGPNSIKENYEAIAEWWQEEMEGSTYGLEALARALRFTSESVDALDVGCGSEGRFLKALIERGFHCTAMDISESMTALAARRHPNVEYAVGDICSWKLPQTYDLITAWDSTFHLPIDQHEAVLEKLCGGLRSGGVLLFTCGGGDEPGTAAGEFGGKPFEYSTVGVPAFLENLTRFGCSVRHIEYDQWPLNHVYIVAQKSAS